MGNHNNGISIFLIYILNQLQNLFGCIVIQCSGRLITEQNIRVLYNGTANGCKMCIRDRNGIARILPVRSASGFTVGLAVIIADTLVS